MKTLKVLSALLTYPSAGLVEAVDELKQVLRQEALLRAPQLTALLQLIDALAAGDLYESQERYLLLFDRTRSLSLHLFEHVHGESRDRGQAMVDLLRLYEEAGYSPTAAELPDFLPLFLEFASTRPPAEALDLLGQPAHVFAALKERLGKRSSSYAAVFDALIALSQVKPDEAALAVLRAEPDPEPDDLAALDAAWEEEEVLFGPVAQQDCGKEGLMAKLRHARRPAPGVAAPSANGARVTITTSPSHRN
jgi:nitrate reductase delta subunit